MEVSAEEILRRSLIIQMFCMEEILQKKMKLQQLRKLLVKLVK